jgi:citrate lyase beta subunit
VSPAPRRSALTVPASEPTKIAKAVTLDADEVVIDLEDAVAPDVKDAARVNVRAVGHRDRGSLAVRVNAPGTAWFQQDLEACAGNEAVASIVVPKVDSRDDLAAVERELMRLEPDARRRRPLDVQALIESPAGLNNVQAIAGATPRLVALIIGYADLAASLGRRPEASWQFAQDAVLLAARVEGIQAIDGPELTVEADERFRQIAARAQALGFDGKWVIHPRQVPIVQEAFTPTEAETAEAQDILAVMEEAVRQGQGAIQWRGRMLDEAVAAQARRVLSRVGGR